MKCLFSSGHLKNYVHELFCIAGVPETIQHLRQAGIVVWVLTGDKQETAVNIAYSCKLFSQDMQIIKLNARNRDVAEATINEFQREINEEINLGRVAGYQSLMKDLDSKPS